MTGLSVAIKIVKNSANEIRTIVNGGGRCGGRNPDDYRRCQRVADERLLKCYEKLQEDMQVSSMERELL